MNQKNNTFFSKQLLTAAILACSLSGTNSFAKVYSLTDITNAAMKQNISIKEKLIEGHQSQQQVHHNRMSLLPKLDLYSIINSGGSIIGVASVIEGIAPFLVPANWFRVNEAEISQSFQSNSMQALWGNEILETRAMYLTMVSDTNSLKVYDSYLQDLQELQDIAETRDQFGGDRLGALEMLLAQKNKVTEDQISLKDLVNQEFYTLSQMAMIDPKTPLEVDSNAKIESSWTYLEADKLIATSQSISPEVQSYDDLIHMLAEIKKEIKFSFFGTSNLSRGVAGGIFDDLPVDGGWSFSTKAAFALTKTKEELLKNQQLGAKETLKRQILRNLDQHKFLIEKEKNLNERTVHLNKQWEILLDRLQFGKNAAMDELIANRESLAATKIALINLQTLRSQLNDKAQRMMWWDVYSKAPRQF